MTTALKLAVVPVTEVVVGFAMTAGVIDAEVVNVASVDHTVTGLGPV